LSEHRTVQCAQLLAWLYTKFVDEQAARVRIDRQRLDLPAGPVERQHQLSAEPLPVRIRIDQRLQIAGDSGLVPEGKVRIDPRFQRSQPKLLQPAEFGGREGLIRELGQRFSPPQTETIVQETDRRSWASFRQGLLARRYLPFEADQIKRPLLDAQEVAMVAPYQRIALAVRGQGLAQPRDVHIQAVLAPGRPLSPDFGQQAGTRNDLVRVQQEDGEDRALFRASQHNRLAVAADLQRP
jgi:hypothetical protein